MSAKTAEQIMAEALAYDPVAKFVGFSGGRDSLAVAAWMFENVDGVQCFHINTGIGIERTREFVRDTCKDNGWPLVEIRAKEDCGMDYDEIIRNHGFPGPAQHMIMYSKLKERSIRELVRRNKTNRHDKVLIATGIMHEESKRRMRYVGEEVKTLGAQLWVSPIYWWSKGDRDRYIDERGLEVNPISKELGMSGECLCGAYAHKGEKEMVRLVCPKTAARIDALEAEALANGFTWGWEGGPPENFTRDQSDMFMPLCIGCEK